MNEAPDRRDVCPRLVRLVQAEVLEGKVGQRISDMEAGFKSERTAMGRKLEDQRLASRERLREVNQSRWPW